MAPCSVTGYRRAHTSHNTTLRWQAQVEERDMALVQWAQRHAELEARAAACGGDAGAPSHAARAQANARETVIRDLSRQVTVD